MLTIRQVDRLWQLQAYSRLIDELCAGRAEATGGIRQLISGPVAAAALVVVRMDELHQGHLPQVSKAVRYILSMQEADGGWGDVVTTALCVRALARSSGTGPAIERGLTLIQALRRDDGEWPREPFKRFEGDPAVTAFVIRQLVETRTDAATALVKSTIDRLTTEEPAVTPGDRQMELLKHRVKSAFRDVRVPQQAA